MLNATNEVCRFVFEERKVLGMPKKLTKRTFCYQMCAYGFFAEQVPPCFTSQTLARKYSKVSKLVGKSYKTSPVNLSTYKTETARRVISVANPYAFASAMEFIGEHFKDIDAYASSSNSESPITFLHFYGEDEDEVINSELARSFLRAKSDFKRNLRNRIAGAMGYRYRLSIDIASFYDTIYTHSLSWAICGKDKAKRMLSDKSQRSDEYRFADELDRHIRNQKNQETNGILTGPFTSRIFSEIILAAIDKELRDMHFVFKRYVDDYKFYFRTKPEAQKAIFDVSKILADFNLSINQSKVEIVEYPFDLESRMRSRLDNALKGFGVYGALMEAGRLYVEGEKGAYKYALKMLQGANIPDDERAPVLSMLLNINLLNPKYARYIVEYLRGSRIVVGEEKLSTIINNELDRSLSDGFEQEVLNLLYFLRTLNLKIKASSLVQALAMDNDFISIIVLDFWVKEKDLVRYTDEEAGKLDESINQLVGDLSLESVDGEHWLLLYEARFHGFLKLGEFRGKTAEFFDEMLKQGVSFYYMP